MNNRAITMPHNWPKCNNNLKTTKPMTEKEQLLADVKALQERIEKLDTATPKFEVGKWYCNYETYKDRNSSKAIFNLERTLGNIGHGFGVCDGVWEVSDGSGYTNELQYYRPATHAEIQEALIAEARRRRLNQGVNIKSYSQCIHSIDLSGGYLYVSLEDKLYALNGIGTKNCNLYEKGVWREIIKDEKIMINSYEVKFSDHTKDTKIDGNLFTREFWQAAKLISEHTKAKIMVGCSKQFDVSLTTINQILSKL